MSSKRENLILLKKKLRDLHFVFDMLNMKYTLRDGVCTKFYFILFVKTENTKKTITYWD